MALRNERNKKNSPVTTETRTLKRRRDRDEWFYRARFEQSGENRWLLEYGRSPSAWQSPWFRQVVRTNVMDFVRWCNNRRISLGKIAKWLNERGPSPSKRATWCKSTLRYLLDRSPVSAEDVAIKTVMMLLKGLRWVERNQQPWLDRITELSESTGERARRVWEMHRLLLPPFRAMSAYLVRRNQEYEREADRFQRDGTPMQRRGTFAFRFLGTKSLPAKTLRDILKDAKSASVGTLAWILELEQLERAVPQFLDLQLSKFDFQVLGKHKTTEGLLRILCRFEGISTRTARRHKSQTVQ
jgi:hypothetical protein